jgi:hypothetical protein
MDLIAFRRAVDDCPAGIGPFLNDPMAQYTYFGLDPGFTASPNAFSEILYNGIRAAFSSGHQGVWRRCKELKAELIQRHVIEDEALDPYFSVLERIVPSRNCFAKTRS